MLHYIRRENNREKPYCVHMLSRSMVYNFNVCLFGRSINQQFGMLTSMIVYVREVDFVDEFSSAYSVYNAHF